MDNQPSNELCPHGKPINPPGVIMDYAYDGRACYCSDCVPLKPPHKRGQRGRPRGAGNKLEACKHWVFEYTEDNPEALVSEILRDGRKAGFSKSTIYNAADALKVSKTQAYVSNGPGAYPVKTGAWIVFHKKAVEFLATTPPKTSAEKSAERVKAWRAKAKNRARERARDAAARAIARQ